MFSGARGRGGRGGVIKERLKERLLRLERTVIPSTVIVAIWIEEVREVRTGQAEEKMSNFFRASL